MRRYASMSEGLMTTGVRASLGGTYGGAGVCGTKTFGSTAGLALPAQDRTRALGLRVTELGFCAAAAVMAPMPWTASQSPASLVVIGEGEGSCSSRRLESLVRGSRRLSTEAGADPGVAMRFPARADGLAGVWKLRIRMWEAFRLGVDALRAFGFGMETF